MLFSASLARTTFLRLKVRVLFTVHCHIYGLAIHRNSAVFSLFSKINSRVFVLVFGKDFLLFECVFRFYCYVFCYLLNHLPEIFLESLRFYKNVWNFLFFLLETVLLVIILFYPLLIFFFCFIRE